MIKRVCFVGVASLLLSFLVASCACGDGKKSQISRKTEEVALVMPGEALPHAPLRAEAFFRPTEDVPVCGRVIFMQVKGGVKIVADVDGLTPGPHGFHIHEYGSCGGKNVSGSGDHFNPTKSLHGSPDSSVRHVGDLGNLIADQNGIAHYERIDHLIRLEGPHSIIGRSIIVHADRDDYTTQPSGASGVKIACGIIEAVSP